MLKLYPTPGNNDLSIPSIECEVSESDIAKILNDNIFMPHGKKNGLSSIDTKIEKVFFSDIKWPNNTFDIRTIWEAARLQNITTLLAYEINNPNNPFSDNIKKYCMIEILKWIKRNPFLYGPHYISVMECGLRIPVLYYCLKLLDNLQLKQIRLIYNTIYQHAWWIAKRLSLYSSLGNHTIAECVGLIFAGSIYCNFKEGKKWFNKGIQILENEAKHQILEDGGPAEQSFHYHRFVLDLYWLAIGFLDSNDLYDCRKLKSRTILGEKFLLAFKTHNGHLSSIGDSDDGFAIAPKVTPKKPILIYSQKKIRIFKTSGYTIISTPNGVQMIFDHGPLGMPPLYNHGHSDALSVTMHKNGKRVLVDPGTYKYNGASKWRRYFKGTKAHNTITIDSFDQADQETEFIWSHPYNVELLKYSENIDKFFISAMHDGYERLKEPVIHKREILFFDDQCFLIKDSFVGKGVHDYEINFHLHPNAAPIKKNRWWQINNEGERIYMRMLENENFLTICGSTDPIHGWYSPSYGKKLKCNVMSCRNRGYPHEISFVTAICTEALIDTKKIKNILHLFE